MSIDWKTIKADNVESLRETPWNYVNALVQLNLWDKLKEAFYDETLYHFATDALLKPKARKNILKNSTEDEIIHLLDTVNQPIRRHLLNILIEQSDDCPVSIQVGDNLLKNRDKHFWIYHNYQEVFSLQSTENLSTAFKARIKPSEYDSLEFFEKCLDKDESYDHDENYLEKTGLYLNQKYFAPFRYLSKRVSFGVLLTELLIDALNGYAKKKRGYLNFVVKPIVEIFFQFSPVWNSNRNAKSIKDAFAKLKDTLLKFPYHLTKKSGIHMSIISNAICDYFKLQSFIDFDIITHDDYLNKIVPEALKNDLELPLAKTRFIIKIVSCMFNITGYENVVFFKVLHTLSETQKDHPLAFLWPKILSLAEEYYIDLANNSNFNCLQTLCSLIYTNDYNANLTIPTYFVRYSFDFVMNLLVKIIRKAIDSKEEIVKKSPIIYKTNMKKIFTTLISNRNCQSDPRIWEQSQSLPFFILPAELRDEIIAEYMCDPTGQKDYSSELSSGLILEPLSVALLFDDLKKMAGSISKEKANKCDKYGFQDKIKFTYPPALDSTTRKAEEAEEKVHVFERSIFRLLRDKDVNIALRAYNIYISFCDKLMTTAIRLDDKELYKLASDSHLRLCRFLGSKVNDEIQPSLINLYCNRIVTPLSIYVGLKVDEQYAQNLYDSSISKFPFTTDTNVMPLLQILNTLLAPSYSTALPGIGEVCAKLTTLILNRLFTDIPASFMNPIQVVQDTIYSNIVLPPSDSQIKAIKDLINSQANLLLPEKYMVKILKNKFNKKKARKINFQQISGVFIDPSLITPELIKEFDPVSIEQGIEPFIAVIEFLYQKKEEYKKEDYQRPTTRLIEFLLQKLRTMFLIQYTYQRDLPSVPFNYEKQNTEATYIANVKKWLTQSFDISSSTACIAKYLLPQDTFLYRLFTSQNFNFDKIDELLNFTPLSIDQSEVPLYYPNKKKVHIRLQVTVVPKPDTSVLLRLRKQDQQPAPKQPHCPRCGTVQPKKVKESPKNVEHEEWIDVISWALIKPLLESDASAFCDAVKNDGLSLFKIVKFLYISLKKNIRCETNLNFIAHLLDLCFKDILIEDPKPTEEEKNPKPSPTLFMDENAKIIGTLKPFTKDKSQRVVRQPVYNRYNRNRVRNVIPTAKLNKATGQPKYHSTKVLIAHLASILSYDIAKGNVDTSIFTPSLISLLSLDPELLKKKIGNDNYSYYTDHIASALLNHFSFGNQIKDLQWASKFETPIIESFFRLFSCDATHNTALEWVNQFLQLLPKVEERNAIISSFVSALSVKDCPGYTLHTRVRTVAWCLDYRYVGCPLPKYCIEFVDALSQDKILHVDIRRAIAAGSVAYFKWRAISKANTDQFEELFKVLQNVYDTAKNAMAPTFCQLIRPKLCKNLSMQNQVYKSLMPDITLPETYISPQNFGKLAMPHINGWEEPHQKFVTTFIGNSLLSKDENIIQLSIQILAKLKIRGGATAEKIAQFVITAFKEFNIFEPSQFLIDFIFNFTIQKPNSEFPGLIDGFVSIFTNIRKKLDEVNNEQIQLYWKKDNKFKRDTYILLSNICNTLSHSFENRMNSIDEKEDYPVAQEISKKVVKELKGEKQPIMFFQPFENLLCTFELFANDKLNQVIMSPTQSEENLRILLTLVKETCLTSFRNRSYPVFVINLFNKHQDLLTLNLIKDELCKWPLEICQDKRIISLINPLFNSFAFRIKDSKEEEEFTNLLPNIWMFVNSI